MREDRLNLDTGSLIFTFKMPIIKEGEDMYLSSGSYPLLTPAHRSGMVEVKQVRDFNGRIIIIASIANAELYSSDKEEVFEISVDFNVDVNPLPTAK